MKPTRRLAPTTPSLAVAGRNQWNQLAQRAIAKAEAAGDLKAVGAIRAGLATGNAEKALRRLSIICDTDIAREFPDP